MQQKGDGNHIILVSKTSYFKDKYCEEIFAFLRQFYIYCVQLAITFLLDHTQHYSTVS